METPQWGVHTNLVKWKTVLSTRQIGSSVDFHKRQEVEIAHSSQYIGSENE